MIGGNDALHNLFNSSGALTNVIDSNFRAVGNNFTVTAHAVSLGQITQTKPITSPSDSLTDADSMVVWSLALLRDPVVRYTRLDGSVENRSPAYLSKFSSRQAAVSLFADIRLFYAIAC